MMTESTDEEIKGALAKLEQAETIARQHTVALCAESAERFGPKFFYEIIDRGWDPTCRWYAIRALGELRAKEYNKVLLDVLRQPNVTVGESSLHRICARSIALLGSDMIPDVVGLLQNPNEATRVSAVDTLGEIGHPDAIPVLSESLASGERNLQLWAALSLAKIGIESIPVLVDALHKASEQDALIILDALVRIADPCVIDAIAVAAENCPDVVRFYFSRTRSERVIEFLRMLQDISSSTTPRKRKAAKIVSLINSKSNIHGDR